MEKTKLKIGRRTYDAASVEEASALYQRLRDASGQGYRTWRDGTYGDLRISYNGRVWSGEKLVREATGRITPEWDTKARAALSAGGGS